MRVLYTKTLSALLASLCLIWLAGCTTQSTLPSKGYYALEGPPLSLAGAYSGMALEGQLEREIMVGIGKVTIQSVNSNENFFCEGSFNTPPTEKNRIRGFLRCSQGKVFVMTLKPTGPDQGIGVGLTEQDQLPLLFFFHPSAEEAKRRFPEEQQLLMQAFQNRSQ